MIVDGYTVFRLLEHGVMPLRRLHAERLGPGASAALQVFSADAAPGLYRARWDGSTLTATPRGPSRLRDGLPTRLAVSPFAHLVGRFPKPRETLITERPNAEGPWALDELDQLVGETFRR
jgi:hypothetical protein